MSRSPLAASARKERTVATVWPSIAAGAWGRWLGRLYGLRAGVRIGGVPLTLGWLLVGLTAPLAALLYLAKKTPRRPLLVVGPVNPDGLCYRLTTERVLIERPFEKGAEPVEQLALKDFDAVAIDVRPGQAWYKVGDVAFLRGGVEHLRLRGVPRPEPFVQTVQKTQQAWSIGRPATSSTPAGEPAAVAVG